MVSFYGPLDFHRDYKHLSTYLTCGVFFISELACFHSSEHDLAVLTAACLTLPVLPELFRFLCLTDKIIMYKNVLETTRRTLTRVHNGQPAQATRCFIMEPFFPP